MYVSVKTKDGIDVELETVDAEILEMFPGARSLEGHNPLLWPVLFGFQIGNGHTFDSPELLAKVAEWDSKFDGKGPYGSEPYMKLHDWLKTKYIIDAWA